MPRGKAKKQEEDYIDLTLEEEELEEAPRPKKSRRSKAGEGKAKAEKRTDAAGNTVRWSSKPPIKTQERIARTRPGSGHRLFLISHKELSPVGSEGGAASEFAVLGATGNVYTVTICRQPQCTCPDFLKGNLCKHILFVNLRVLRMPEDEPLVWQRALLTNEVNAVLGGQKSVGGAGPSVLASEAVQEQYRRMSAGGSGEAGPSGSGLRKPVEGDCPICFEPLEASATSAEYKVSFCAGSCGNNVHVGCMRMWSTQHHPPTCPLCRAPWVDGLNPKAAQAGQPKQYKNLAQYSQAHQQADTSLEALYGDRSVWIRANQGEIGRQQAASLWRSMR